MARLTLTDIPTDLKDDIMVWAKQERMHAGFLVCQIMKKQVAAWKKREAKDGD